MSQLDPELEAIVDAISEAPEDVRLMFKAMVLEKLKAKAAATDDPVKRARLHEAILYWTSQGNA